MSTSIVDPTRVALVLETNNLNSPGAATRVTSTLARLLEHLRGQSIALDRLGEIVITHEGLDAAACRHLERAAGRPVAFVDVQGADYYTAKNLGFRATRSEVVVFADSDCWPDREWLRRLLEPIALGHRVVAGRTSYRDDRFGRAATSIDFMYFRPRRDRTRTRNFYANNVAFVRDVFAGREYSSAPMYRGACQLLGLRLFAEGVAVHFAPAAHTVHRLPDTWEELVELRLRRGRDLRLLAPHLLATYGPVRGCKPRRATAMAVLAGRWAFSAADLRRDETGRRAGMRGLALMTAITALDAAGVLLRKGDATGDREPSLSYHADIDHLATAPPSAG